MTEADVLNYVKTQLGVSWVDVEVEKKDIQKLITMTLDKLAPYYEGKRFVQASGKVIDLSNHHPLTIEKVYNEIVSVVAERTEYDYEIIAVNDHSPDGVFQVLRKLAGTDEKFRVLDLAKNFGK